MKEKERCNLCGHLLSKHPRPRHLVGYGEWDYHTHTCCVKSCQCPLSCFRQLLNEKGMFVKDTNNDKG